MAKSIVDPWKSLELEKKRLPEIQNVPVVQVQLVIFLIRSSPLVPASLPNPHPPRNALSRCALPTMCSLKARTPLSHVMYRGSMRSVK